MEETWRNKVEQKMGRQIERESGLNNREISELKVDRDGTMRSIVSKGREKVEWENKVENERN